MGTTDTTAATAAPAGTGHRERLLAAMAESVKAKGLRATTVSDVVRIARTSRRTFYEHFADREACFLALADVLDARIERALAAAVDPAMPWEEQVDRAIDAYLGTVAGDPGLLRAYLREVVGLGERGVVAQRVSTERFARVLVGLVKLSRARHPEIRDIDLDTAVFCIAGLREIVTTAVDQGRDLAEVRPVLTTTIKAVLAPPTA